jgi:hypothetical protein
MNINFGKVKDVFLWGTFIAVIFYLIYLNRSCQKDDDTAFALSNSAKEKQAIADANDVIDSLLFQIDSLKKVKRPIEERIKFRNIYLASKRDTVRKLIKDSSVLAYVDTLEAKVGDQDSVIKIQVAEILKLEDVLIQKDTVIYNKDLIITKSEEEYEVLQVDNKKKEKRIKLLKVERILYPAIVTALAIILAR